MIKYLLNRTVRRIQVKMKFKSLFRRKASPTGNDANNTMSPSASSISHSSSSSSIATNSASSPVHSANGVEASSSQGLSTSPITITSRIRTNEPPSAQFLLYHDEASSQSEFPIAAVNEDVIQQHLANEGKGESEYEDSHSRRSSSSEVSLACLQGRIQQMEETHHSTNEELQATLQELADLQVQLNESQADNYKLNEEKLVVKRKLELRTEQFQQAREQVETMKQHLLLQCNESEDERKSLLGKQTELSKLLTTQQAVTSEREQHVTWLKARVRNLETSINEGDSKLHNELSKLLKENEKLKMDKESTEGTVLNAQDQLAQAMKENLLLKQQICALQEENRSVKQKSKEEVADLEYKLEQLLAKKQSLVVETGTLHSAVVELETACRRHLEDKREMRSAAAQQQLRLADALRCREEQEKLLSEEKMKVAAKLDEWQQFQKDLLTTVRVANDFKLETLAQMEKVIEENRKLREKLVLAHTDPERSSTSSRNAAPVKPRVLRSLSTVDTSGSPDVKARTIAVATRVDKGSVKRIIENLETSENLKTVSRQKSTDASPTNQSLQELSPPVATVRPRSEPIRPTQLHRTESETVFLRSPVRLEVRSSLGESIYGKAQTPPLKIGYSASDLTPLTESTMQASDRKDPLAGLVKNGGSKRNALLKWCQTRTANYSNIDITNFSSSWNDGLALCALLHTFIPNAIAVENLTSSDVRYNFQMAFQAAESIGIPTSLDIDELASSDRPDWQSIMTYITTIYKHFSVE